MPQPGQRGVPHPVGQDVQRLPLSEPRSFTFGEAGDFGITKIDAVEGAARVCLVDAVEGAALEQGVPRMSVILALNGSELSELLHNGELGRLWNEVRPLTLTVRPPADLRGVKLPGARLEGANLKGSDLRGAELEKAVLQKGHVLDPPDVEGLEGAALGKAWAAWAARYEGGVGGWREKGRYDKRVFFKPAEKGAKKPRAADLVGAKLAGTNLTGADLRGVDLDGVEGSEGVELPAVEGKEGKVLGEAWWEWGRALRNKPGEPVRGDVPAPGWPRPDYLSKKQEFIEALRREIFHQYNAARADPQGYADTTPGARSPQSSGEAHRRGERRSASPSCRRRLAL